MENFNTQLSSCSSVHDPRVWRVGTNWGISVLDLFVDYGIAFFCPDSGRIGKFHQVKDGDIAIISEGGLEVKVIARIASAAKRLIEFDQSFGPDIKEYEDSIGFKISNIHILDKKDRFNSGDRKRFYEVRDDAAKKAITLFNIYDQRDRSGQFSIKSRAVSLFERIDKNDAIFSKKTRYMIPIYQRPYSWGETEISRLFQDIQLSIKEGHDEPIFMGTMQLSAPVPLGKEGECRYDIIDGQQRITSFFLIVRILNLMGLRKTEPIDFNKSIRTIVANGAEQRKLNRLLEVENIQGLIDADAGDNVYVRNAQLIHEECKKLTEPVDANDKDFITLDQLVRFIDKNIQFVIIETHAGLSKTIKIFNAINTTGLDLNGSDVFKVRFFEFLTSRKGCEQTCFESISDLYKRIDEKNEECGKAVTSMLEVLSILQALLIARYNLSDALFDYGTDRFFEEMFNALLGVAYPLHFNKEKMSAIVADPDSPLSIEKIGKLIDYRYEFEKRYYSSESSLKNAALQQFLWGHSRYRKYWHYPIIYQYQMGQHGVDKFNEVLTKLALSYSIIYGKSVYHIHSAMRKALKAVFSPTDATAVEILSSHLNESESKLRNSLENNQIASNSKWKNIICRLSEYLEHLELVESPNCAVINKLFYSRIDIEHIQSYHDKDGNRREEIWREWGASINGIGNLAILEENVNRSIGNNNFSEKRLRYKESHYSVINKLAGYSDWTLSDCKKRAEQEVEKLMKFFFDDQASG